MAAAEDTPFDPKAAQKAASEAGDDIEKALAALSMVRPVGGKRRRGGARQKGRAPDSLEDIARVEAQHDEDEKDPEYLPPRALTNRELISYLQTQDPDVLVSLATREGHMHLLDATGTLLERDDEVHEFSAALGGLIEEGADVKYVFRDGKRVGVKKEGPARPKPRVIKGKSIILYPFQADWSGREGNPTWSDFVEKGVVFGK